MPPNCSDDSCERHESAHDFYPEVLGFEKVFENGNPVEFMTLTR